MTASAARWAQVAPEATSVSNDARIHWIFFGNVSKLVVVTRTSVTMLDVADAAGVGVGTVSRVLNRGSVSVRTRARVQRAVDKLGFTPSASARNLKLGKTGIVGIAGASLVNPWFTALLDGMQHVLAHEGHSIAVCGWGQDGTYDPSPVRAWINRRRIDHLVLVRPGEREKPLAAAAWKAGISVVSLASDMPVRRGLRLRADNLDGGRIAGDHLLALGHNKIAFLGGPNESIDVQHRLAGLRERLEGAGYRLPASRVRFAKDYELASGFAHGQRWLETSRLRQATAVVLGSDALALGFMRAALAAGVRIPVDVSVLGFDGVPAGEFTFPALTTVSQPIRQMGSDIAVYLQSPQAGKSKQISYPLTLLTRESTTAAKR